MITQSELKKLVKYNKTTGLMTWAINMRKNQVPAGKIVGSLNDSGYMRTKINGKDYLCHRLIWLYVHGKWPENLIDHINGIKTDNRIKNLREANHKQNLSNVHKPSSRNKTGYLGVSYIVRDKIFMACIGVNLKTYNLGSYKTAKEASYAYLAAKKIYHTHAYQA